MLGKYELLQFDYRGKYIKGFESNGSAFLNMWALRNTNGKKMSVVRNVETKEIVCVVQGRGMNEFPKVIDTKVEIEKLGLHFLEAE